MLDFSDSSSAPTASVMTADLTPGRPSPPPLAGEAASTAPQMSGLALRHRPDRDHPPGVVDAGCLSTGRPAVVLTGRRGVARRGRMGAQRAESGPHRPLADRGRSVESDVHHAGAHGPRVPEFPVVWRRALAGEARVGGHGRVVRAPAWPGRRASRRAPGRPGRGRASRDELRVGDVRPRGSDGGDDGVADGRGVVRLRPGIGIAALGGRCGRDGSARVPHESVGRVLRSGARHRRARDDCPRRAHRHGCLVATLAAPRHHRRTRPPRRWRGRRLVHARRPGHRGCPGSRHLRRAALAGIPVLQLADVGDTQAGLHARGARRPRIVAPRRARVLHANVDRDRAGCLQRPRSLPPLAQGGAGGASAGVLDRPRHDGTHPARCRQRTAAGVPHPRTGRPGGSVHRAGPSAPRRRVWLASDGGERCWPRPWCSAVCTW